MVPHTASASSFSLSSGASLMFPAGARSPPCSGLHCREKLAALCAQAPTFACVSSGSRWTVLWGYSNPRASPCGLRSCRPDPPLLTSGKHAPITHPVPVPMQEDRKIGFEMEVGQQTSLCAKSFFLLTEPDPPLLRQLHSEMFLAK